MLAYYKVLYCRRLVQMFVTTTLSLGALPVSNVEVGVFHNALALRMLEDLQCITLRSLQMNCSALLGAYSSAL